MLDNAHHINKFFGNRDFYNPNEIDEKDITPVIYGIQRSLQLFFEDKKWGVGGNIPNELIYTKRNFRLLNNIPLKDAVTIGYRCIAESGRKVQKGWDIKTLLKVIRECENRGVPQEHQGGLFLLYLEICERVKLS